MVKGGGLGIVNIEKRKEEKMRKMKKQNNE
jgi:hypothetical protein